MIFTGATASLKGSALWSSFATGKWAQRALAQSLAREFGPKGVHVAHAVIDGVIDIPATKEWLKDAGPDAKISPDSVSEITEINFFVPVRAGLMNFRLRTHTGTCIHSREHPSPLN